MKKRRGHNKKRGKNATNEEEKRPEQLISKRNDFESRKVMVQQQFVHPMIQTPDYPQIPFDLSHLHLNLEPDENCFMKVSVNEDSVAGLFDMYTESLPPHAELPHFREKSRGIAHFCCAA